MAKLKDPKTWVLEEDTSEAPSSLSIGFIRITENNNLNKQELINLTETIEKLEKYPGLKFGDIEEANNNAGNWE